jgi:hypothetical protein
MIRLAASPPAGAADLIAYGDLRELSLTRQGDARNATFERSGTPRQFSRSAGCAS